MLYDYDALDKDDEIGEAKLAVADLKNQEEKDVWLNVEEMTPDGSAQHKVNLVYMVWSGTLRASTLLLHHGMQHEEYDSQKNSCLIMPSCGEVLMPHIVGASHQNWSWDLVTCGSRPQIAS